MREMGLARSQQRRKPPTMDSQHSLRRYANLVKDLEVTYPGQVWVSDITYMRLRNEFVYLAAIMDVFARAVRGWHLSRSLDQLLTLVALRKALRAPVPKIHRNDQRVQYAANGYVEGLCPQVGAHPGEARAGASPQPGLGKPAAEQRGKGERSAGHELSRATTYPRGASNRAGRIRRFGLV